MKNLSLSPYRFLVHAFTLLFYWFLIFGYSIPTKAQDEEIPRRIGSVTGQKDPRLNSESQLMLKGVREHLKREHQENLEKEEREARDKREKELTCDYKCDCVKQWVNNDVNPPLFRGKNEKGELEITLNFSGIRWNELINSSQYALEKTLPCVQPTDLQIEMTYAATYETEQEHPDGLSKRQLFAFTTTIRKDENKASAAFLKEPNDEVIPAIGDHELFITPAHNFATRSLQKELQTNKTYPGAYRSNPFKVVFHNAFDYQQTVTSFDQSGTTPALNKKELHYAVDPSTAKVILKVRIKDCPTALTISRHIAMDNIPSRIETPGGIADAIEDLRGAYRWVQSPTRGDCFSHLTENDFESHPRGANPSASFQNRDWEKTMGMLASHIRMNSNLFAAYESVQELEKSDPRSQWSETQAVYDQLQKEPASAIRNYLMTDKKLLWLAIARPFFRASLINDNNYHYELDRWHGPLMKKLDGMIANTRFYTEKFRNQAKETRQWIERLINLNNNASLRLDKAMAGSALISRQDALWRLSKLYSMTRQLYKEKGMALLGEDFETELDQFDNAPKGSLLACLGQLRKTMMEQQEAYAIMREQILEEIEAIQKSGQPFPEKLIQDLHYKLRESTILYEKIKQPDNIAKLANTLFVKDIDKMTEVVPIEPFRPNVFGGRNLSEERNKLQKEKAIVEALREKSVEENVPNRTNDRTQSPNLNDQSRTSVSRGTGRTGTFSRSHNTRSTARNIDTRSNSSNRSNGVAKSINEGSTRSHLGTEELTLYPTITNGQITVEGLVNDARIFDAQGQLILVMETNTLPSDTDRAASYTTIDVSGWSQGLYLLRSGQEMKRFVVNQ